MAPSGRSDGVRSEMTAYGWSMPTVK